LNRSAARRVIAAAALVALAVGVRGQDPAAPNQSTPAPHQEPRWRITDTSIDLGTLIEISARALNRHIEFERDKVTGNVAVDRPGNFTEAEIWQIANRELYLRGLASVQPPGTDSLRIVPVGDAAALARLEDYDFRASVAGFVKVFVPMAKAKPENLLETIKLLLSKSGGSAIAVREGNALLISDYRPHVEQALRVIEIMEQPQLQPTVEEVSLEHVSAVTMSALIERVVNARKTLVDTPLRGNALPLAETQSMLVVAPPSEMSWWRSTIAEFDRPEPVTTLHYIPRRFGLSDTAKLIEATVHETGAGDAPGTWKLVQDTLTGTLIVTTTPKKHAEIQDLLTRLDQTAEGPSKPLRAYPIKHRRVEDLLDLLQSLLDAGVLEQAKKDSAEPAAPVQGATGEIKTPAASSLRSTADRRITIAADNGANRILAFGEAPLLDQLEQLIATLDVREAQVMVEALVVTLTESQSLQVGIELQSIGTSGGTSARFASLFGLGSPDPAGSVLPPSTSTGFSTVVLNPGDFSAVVHALETLNEGRALTIPKVLVNNNVQATLDSTLQTPYASTNASNTVATTSFGGTFDAGTSVQVKPQVADGDQIVMEYTVSLSRFTGAASLPSLPPPREENKLTSVVTVPDGFTVVVGGLEVETQGKGESRVPWLGAIPFLGNLFKDQSTNDTKSRFFVFLRCNVMRANGFEDLKYASQRETELAGVDDGWPKLEPRVMR
jgi:type II secretory pathway component GspD/PulD (secretin)